LVLNRLVQTLLQDALGLYRVNSSTKYTREHEEQLEFALRVGWGEETKLRKASPKRTAQLAAILLDLLLETQDRVLFGIESFVNILASLLHQIAQLLEHNKVVLHCLPPRFFRNSNQSPSLID
jgi:hypothetical protein